MPFDYLYGRVMPPARTQAVSFLGELVSLGELFLSMLPGASGFIVVFAGMVLSEEMWLLSLVYVLVRFLVGGVQVVFLL